MSQTRKVLIGLLGITYAFLSGVMVVIIACLEKGLIELPDKITLPLVMLTLPLLMASVYCVTWACRK